MKHRLFFLLLIFSFTSSAQDTARYHRFSAGINLISGAFKNLEFNTEFMLNQRIGITSDFGYQFSTNAGENLNLSDNRIQGFYGKIGPRFYFAPHSSIVTGYLAAGYISSYFKQTASILESDFYEPSKFVISTEQKLLGTYLGLGVLVQLPNRFSLDFGTTFNFFSPKNVNFTQDNGSVTFGQPGFGNFIFRSSSNFGMGIGINFSLKYQFLQQ